MKMEEGKESRKKCMRKEDESERKTWGKLGKFYDSGINVRKSKKKGRKV